MAGVKRLWFRAAPLLLFGSVCSLNPRAAWAHPGPNAELRQFEARIQADPENTALRVRYAEAAIRAGHLHEAEHQTQAVARLDPGEREVHRLRGEIWLGRDRPKAAEREFSRYLADGVKNAGSGRAYAARARLRHAAGKLELARADYDAAIPLSPTPELILERGSVDEAREALDDVVAGYHQGLARIGPAITIQLALVDAQRRHGQPRAALETIDTLLSHSYARPDWLLIRAELLDALDQPLAGLFQRVAALYFAHRNLRRRPTSANRLVLAQVETAFAIRDRP